MRLTAHFVSAPKLRHGSSIRAERGWGSSIRAERGWGSSIRAERGWDRAKRRRRRLVWGTRARILRVSGLGLAALGLTAGLWWLNASGRADALAATAADIGFEIAAIAGLTVDNVLVEGRAHLGRDEIAAALDIEHGMPILAFDPRDAQAKLTALGWVETADVTRKLPGTVFVSVTERRALAVWQLDGALALIDAAGTVITRDVAAFADLPYVVGPGAQTHAAELLATLEDFPEITAGLAAAIRVSDRRWDLVLAQGTKVRLPEAGIAEALANLVDMQRDYAILGQEILSIDLRVPDRLIVRMPPEGRTGEPTNANGEDI